MGCGATKTTVSPPAEGTTASAGTGANTKGHRPKKYLRLTYRSKLRPNCPIAEIIRRANLKNDRLDVAGALWYNAESNEIRQILEGEHDQVRELFGVISKDPRHYDIVVEIEEFPMKRAYKKWGGMAFADNPEFADPAKDCGVDLYKLQISYRCTPKHLREFIDNSIDDEDFITLGRVFYCRVETGEVLERLEGDRAQLEALVKNYKNDHWLNDVNVGHYESIKERGFHVFSKQDISRFSSSDDSVKRIKFKVGKDTQFLAAMYNTWDVATGSIQAVVMFREATSAKHAVNSKVTSSDVNLETLEAQVLGSIRATPKVDHAPEVKGGDEKAEKYVKELPGLNLEYYIMHPPLGFMVRRLDGKQKSQLDVDLDGKEEEKKGTEQTPDKLTSIVTPTTNIELKKMCRGKVCRLLGINDVNVTLQGGKQVAKVLREAQEKYPIKLRINLQDAPGA
uniref:BLUF domain-containing protein n=1 Tax=Lotharella globosa TaxID=91324 RepID=A0A7S4DDL6_9EUKA|mmetsp:Transcript_22538/g.45267  ORF Transcript_22538/g.45267 Transcript_22538/m.45267 type:complete len:452 (+) Transcript_22538:170-1525(+)|eukprot:CAMPEP_0167789300 /NCGR_PEP_ID=MMETSP0111_2-20121227/10600_1 /TAXON_ID=91324 /ORGANISM="Lotharella globosa, Strain CCCM811" /LENGTH=451 /DNA_ID=CAMNT_0007681435 /DNA_START=161 /DNA_END=1516 /DNA_ORIENTATION=-